MWAISTRRNALSAQTQNRFLQNVSVCQWKLLAVPLLASSVVSTLCTARAGDCKRRCTTNTKWGSYSRPIDPIVRVLQGLKGTFWRQILRRKVMSFAQPIQVSRGAHYTSLWQHTRYLAQCTRPPSFGTIFFHPSSKHSYTLYLSARFSCCCQRVTPAHSTMEHILKTDTSSQTKAKSFSSVLRGKHISGIKKLAAVQYSSWKRFPNSLNSQRRFESSLSASFQLFQKGTHGPAEPIHRVFLTASCRDKKYEGLMRQYSWWSKHIERQPFLYRVYKKTWHILTFSNKKMRVAIQHRTFRWYCLSLKVLTAC